jgi:predicted phage tail protein
MKTVYLHGTLQEQFGGPFTFDVKHPREACRALCQLKGFREVFSAGAWHILRGPLEDQDSVSEDDLEFTSSCPEIHILPAASGAGNGGGLSMVLGVVALAAATFFTGGVAAGLYAAGAGLLVGGIIQATMKIPGADTDTSGADERSSFLFNGPKNSSNQGVAIPRGYGRMRCGSIVISAGLFAEDIPLDSTGISA